MKDTKKLRSFHENQTIPRLVPGLQAQHTREKHNVDLKMKTGMPPPPKYPATILGVLTSHGWLDAELEVIKAYCKSCYQAGVDASVETLKCDTELVNAKAENAVLRKMIHKLIHCHSNHLQEVRYEAAALLCHYREVSAVASKGETK